MPTRSISSAAVAPSMQTPGDPRPPTTKWGWALPVACAAHCAATPALVVLAPTLAMGEGLEWSLMAVSGSIAAWMTWSSEGSRERPALVALLLSGVLLWGASLAGWTSPLPEPITSSGGALLLALGMFLTARTAGAKGARCDCSACQESTFPGENPGAGVVPDFPLRGR